MAAGQGLPPRAAGRFRPGKRIMTPEQHRRLGEIVFAAADLYGPERRAYLDEACGGDALLREAAERVLDQNGDEKTVPMRLSVEAADAILCEGGVPPEWSGPYRIICKIGEGGMGAVYEAEQDTPRRNVAIKMLRPGYGSAALVRRFRREIELLGRLQHPGIAQVYGAGSAPTPAGEAPYFAMELVRGLPLNQYAGKHTLSNDDRLRLVALICDAVQFAHQHGVIHRDLKPANILVVGEEATERPATAGRLRDGATKASEAQACADSKTASASTQSSVLSPQSFRRSRKFSTSASPERWAPTSSRSRRFRPKSARSSALWPT